MTRNLHMERALQLGLEHAQLEASGRARPILRSGIQVADALGYPATLSGTDYIRLFQGYQAGWASYWTSYRSA